MGCDHIVSRQTLFLCNNFTYFLISVLLLFQVGHFLGTPESQMWQHTHVLLIRYYLTITHVSASFQAESNLAVSTVSISTLRSTILCSLSRVWPSHVQSGNCFTTPHSSQFDQFFLVHVLWFVLHTLSFRFPVFMTLT
jgi:hypothetical protein